MGKRLLLVLNVVEDAFHGFVGSIGEGATLTIPSADAPCSAARREHVSARDVEANDLSAGHDGPR
ncbi:hypothetical protein [Chondromyces apiculatus]|uniref:hypothetical protein n=1 Tax=Chondromyces apiculatus TaxID=51 RepID=UPI0018CBF8F3|nr:hypothetical protein [Chondromyces apiculatus]